MRVFSVFAAPPERPRALQQTVVLAERFSWFAALLPLFWALAHQLWLVALLIAGFVVLLAILAPVLGEAVAWLYLLAAVWLGFEAPHLRARSLLRRGWRFAGDAVEAGPELAEREFLRREVSAP